MTLVSLVTRVLASLTLAGGIILLLVLILAIFRNKKGFVERLWGFLKKNSLLFAFIVALVATSGSLFFSEIAHYTPCKLCWFQRIFMYPQALLLGIALIRKARDIRYYAIPMSVIGGVFSVVQYILQRLEVNQTCSATVPCSTSYFYYFGYITIPMMALTGFVMIIAFVGIQETRRTKY